jgi:glycosyltransferase involved in cell wall biosynthesis
LTLLAPINSFTGYGLHSIQIARDVEAITGAYVQIRAVSISELFGATIPPDIRQRFVTGPQPEPWELLVHPANFAPTPGKRTAYFTMWETTRLPAMGPHLLNQSEVVITPCVFCASTFSACGVTTPIRVVPLGIDTEIYRWRNFLPGNDVVFGAAGRMAHGGVRKGLADVIAAFGKAFPKRNFKDVRLKVKCHPDCGIQQTGDPRIEITAAHLTKEQLADWYASLTCFVSVARGEGWGLMQSQSMATGRPLMSPKFAGVAEFFEENCGYALPFKMEPAQGMYEGHGHWAVVSEKDLIEGMRLAYRQRAILPQIGAVASERASRFTWENSNRKLVSVLREFGAL